MCQWISPGVPQRAWHIHRSPTEGGWSRNRGDGQDGIKPDTMLRQKEVPAVGIGGWRGGWVDGEMGGKGIWGEGALYNSWWVPV